MITVQAHIARPIDRVWQLYTSPDAIVQWNAASEDWHTTSASVDLQVGGTFSSRMEAKDGSMGFDFAGTYTVVQKPTLIEYDFGSRHARVEFLTVDTGTQVTVAFDPETENDVEMQRTGWQNILDSFARFCETS